MAGDSGLLSKSCQAASYPCFHRRLAFTGRDFLPLRCQKTHECLTMDATKRRARKGNTTDVARCQGHSISVAQGSIDLICALLRIPGATHVACSSGHAGMAKNCRVLHSRHRLTSGLELDIGHGAASAMNASSTPARREKTLRGAPFHLLEYIHKINHMQQILKRLDNLQHSLYWLNHINCCFSLNRLSLRGFVFDPIEKNSARKSVAAFGQAATRPDYA